MRRHLAVGLVALVGACLVGWTASSRTPEREMWEYQEVQLPAEASANPRLNQYGAAGWELVSVISPCTSSCTFIAYFKRPR